MLGLPYGGLGSLGIISQHRDKGLADMGVPAGGGGGGGGGGREEVGWREWEGRSEGGKGMGGGRGREEGVGGRRGGRREGGRGVRGGKIEGGRGVGRDKALSNGDLRGGKIEHDVPG